MSLRPKNMAGKKESQSGPRYGFHGDKAGICYRTEVGAKIRAPKKEGILIVADRAGFYWRLDKSGVYDDERVVAIRKEGKWISPTKTKPWTKNNRNKWTWNEDPEFTVEIYKYDTERYYLVDLWWKGWSAEIDGAATRKGIDHLAQKFLREENPRKYFEEAFKYDLDRMNYKKEEPK